MNSTQSLSKSIGYKQIFTPEEEIHFWSLQIKEHMNFIYLGLADKLDDEKEVKEIKEENNNLGNKCTKKCTKKCDKNLKQIALILKDLWHDVHQCIVKKCEILKLIDETLNFQLKLQNYIKNGIWIGWLSFSFIDHLNKELLYFKDKLMKHEYILSKELNFWLWHHASEFKTAEKLVDPLEKELCLLMKDYIVKVEILKADLKNTDNINNYTKEILDEYLIETNLLKNNIIKADVLTNISIALINHVIREGEHAIAIISKLS